MHQSLTLQARCHERRLRGPPGGLQQAPLGLLRSLARLVRSLQRLLIERLAIRLQGLRLGWLPLGWPLLRRSRPQTRLGRQGLSWPPRPGRPGRLGVAWGAQPRRRAMPGTRPVDLAADRRRSAGRTRRPWIRGETEAGGTVSPFPRRPPAEFRFVDGPLAGAPAHRRQQHTARWARPAPQQRPSRDRAATGPPGRSRAWPGPARPRPLLA